MEKTWREAITRVLNEATGAMHYSDIAEEILTKNYYKSEGATPAATVNSQIASSIKSDGEKSPYRRIAPGTFALAASITTKPSIALPASASNSTPISESEAKTKFINAFGMYWQREHVIWKKAPKLYGRAPGSTVSIDFSPQRGIYILYDHHTPVYVGRSIEQSISQRLLQHTLGRIAGRWNRFSWFGTMSVSQDGELHDVATVSSEADVVKVLEALLIEALEPPQNRRQGDGFAGCEFVQDIDPEIKKNHFAATLRAIEKKLTDE